MYNYNTFEFLHIIIPVLLMLVFKYYCFTINFDNSRFQFIRTLINECRSFFLLVKSLNMTILRVIVILLQVVLVSSQTCPTWFIRQANKCECGQQINTILQCLNVTNKTEILESFCLTYNNDTEHFGACPYNTNSRLSQLMDVPSDLSKLYEEMCGPLNRTELLCSHCQPGLGQAVFSYYKDVRNACYSL